MSSPYQKPLRGAQLTTTIRQPKGGAPPRPGAPRSSAAAGLAPLFATPRSRWQRAPGGLFSPTGATVCAIDEALPMPVTPLDRPIDQLREETVDQLIMNYGHGKLSREAFERRLDEALDTKSHDRLVELTHDLDLKADRKYATEKKAELGIRVEPGVQAGVESDDTEHIINVFSGNTRKGGQDDEE
jgi:hypothetical protein